MIFRRNYLAELPDDIMRMIYKNLYDNAVKSIKTCDLNKNLVFYEELRDTLTLANLSRDELFNIYQDLPVSFPYLQIRDRKCNTSYKYFYEKIEENVYGLKYSKINSEQINIDIDKRYGGLERFEDRYNHLKKSVDIGMVLSRKMLVIPHDIKIIKVKSKALKEIKANGTNNFYKKLTANVRGISGIHEHNYDIECKYFIQEDYIYFVVKNKDSISCLGELLCAFEMIFYGMIENLIDFCEDLDTECIVEEGEPIRGNLKYLQECRDFGNKLEDELRDDDYLLYCGINLNGVVAEISSNKGVCNVYSLGGDTTDEDDEETNFSREETGEIRIVYPSRNEETDEETDSDDEKTYLDLERDWRT